MANGTIDLGTSGNLTGQIVWSSYGNGSAANSSTVTADLQIKRTNTATTTGTFSFWLAIDDGINPEFQNTTWYGSISGSWITISTISKVVPHSADGAGSCYINAKVNGPKGTSLSSCTVEAGKWVTLGTYYTVTYDANGGSLGYVPSTTKSDVDGKITTSNHYPQRTGYPFLGWNTEYNGTGTWYYAHTDYTISSSFTLYAQWAPPNSHYFVYDANGGVGEMPNSVFQYEGQYQLSPCTFTRDGYRFSHWNTLPDNSGSRYDDSESGTVWWDYDVTLYAQWERLVYTVSYDANGGSGAPSSQTKTHDVSLILSSIAPTRPGYTFLGWSTSSTASSATYQPGDNFTTNAGTTLYAVWERSGLLYINQDGTYVSGTAWINDRGTWKKGIPWINTNGTWKKGGN